MTARTNSPDSLGDIEATRASGTKRIKVLHFVTGGFSGATQVALDLCLASLQSERIEAALVLRRKRTTDDARVQALRDKGLQVWVLPGWSHLATIWVLRQLCLQWRPQVLVAHGFPEHLLGRWAGLWAGVKALVQVEHNSRERYSWWRLTQARWLSQRSTRLIGVSEGVKQRLLQMGMPPEKTMAIPNGIDLARYEGATQQDFLQRQPDLVMSARFARQKDQPSLIRALGLLKAQGLSPKLYLAGSGKASYRAAAQTLVSELGLQEQVVFLGHHGDMPGLLMSQQIFVLSTHYEGMPLALVEAMAAGCACVASLVPGVEGVLEDGVNGLLVPESDPPALAQALARLLKSPAYAAELGRQARQRALQAHGRELMTRRYEDLLASL
ncbi:glycosyltransferase [Paucibacter sp. Y2R2-4]|uniref:glycosyltransferase n=1 Tax=Paucibacter sp. Y2R2-4 TaxID=2893553 RepID=UPI0021E50C1F|nr:glycosyltransferase [Paucibacter sp. Y2R2-4]MCV2348730.1 glycosyltransferase [Paucibacter sp. Y2R2-4]